ncbi:hypothetical protein C3L57_07665, partial [Veillonellaceae bacterium M2-8]|nr:hypothetical protein [Veillonellaceae bacterium M2-8]
MVQVHLGPPWLAGIPETHVCSTDNRKSHFCCSDILFVIKKEPTQRSGGVKIKKSKLRGILSQGMFCSAK